MLLQNILNEIKGFFDFAQIQVEKPNYDMGASGAVNFVLGLSGKKVGIAYKERVEKGFYAVSIRGSATCKVHLGRLVNNTAGQFGGSGGGHDKACGATFQRQRLVHLSKK